MLSQNCFSNVQQTTVSRSIPSTHINIDEGYKSTTLSTARVFNCFQNSRQACLKNSVITRSTSSSPVSVDETEDSLISCLCSDPQDDGQTILCSRCSTWQHIACIYPGSAALVSHPGFVHLCVACSRGLMKSGFTTVVSSLDHTNAYIVDNEITVGNPSIEKLLDRRKQIRETVPQDPGDWGRNPSNTQETVHYCVKWLGFGYERCTWESADCLPSDMVALYEEVCSRGERTEETIRKRSRMECSEIEEDAGDNSGSDYCEIEGDIDDTSGSEYCDEENAGDNSGSDYSDSIPSKKRNTEHTSQWQLARSKIVCSKFKQPTSSSEKRISDQRSQRQRASSKPVCSKFKQPTSPQRHKRNWPSTCSPLSELEDPDLVIWQESKDAPNEITRRSTSKGLGTASQTDENKGSPKVRQTQKEKDTEIFNDVRDTVLPTQRSRLVTTPAPSCFEPVAEPFGSNILKEQGNRSRSNPMFMTPDVDGQRSLETDVNGSDKADIFSPEQQPSQEPYKCTSSSTLRTYDAPVEKRITDSTRTRLASLASEALSILSLAPPISSSIEFRKSETIRLCEDEMRGRVESTNVSNVLLGTSNKEDEVDIKCDIRLQKWKKLSPIPFPTQTASCSSTGFKIYEQQRNGRHKFQRNGRFDATIVQREPDKGGYESATFTPEAPLHLTPTSSCSPHTTTAFQFHEIVAMERANDLLVNTNQRQLVVAGADGDRNYAPAECFQRMGYTPCSPEPFSWDPSPTLNLNRNSQDCQVEHGNHIHVPGRKVIEHSAEPQTISEKGLEASRPSPQPRSLCHTQHPIQTSTDIDNPWNQSSSLRTVTGLDSGSLTEPEQTAPRFAFPTSSQIPSPSSDSELLFRLLKQLDAVQNRLEKARASRREKITALRKSEIRVKMRASGHRNATWNERDELVLEVGRASEEIWGIEGEEGGLELLIRAARGLRPKKRSVHKDRWRWEKEGEGVDWEGLGIDD